MAFNYSPYFQTYEQKQLSFFAQPDPRDPTTIKDQRLVNVFGEAYQNTVTGDVYITVRKRPGLVKVVDLTDTGEVRGVYSIQGRNFFVVNMTLFEYTGTTLSNRFTLPGTAQTSGRIGFSYMPTSADSYLMFTDGVTLWQMDLTSNAVATNTSTYPTPMLPYLETIDGYLLAVKKGTADIYSSQPADITSGWDFTSAEMYPDNLVGLSRYNNYLAACGAQSIEFFYDAALTSGSPFVRNMSAVQTIGVVAPDSALQTDTKFFFIGTTGEGERTVWMLENFKPVEIATPYIRESLNAETDITSAYCFPCRFMGHQFYVIQLSEVTWAYDTYTKLWSQWTYNGGNFVTTMPFDNLDGTSTFVTSTSLYKFDDATYQDLGHPIACMWQTVPIDFDTMNRKSLFRMVLVGDIPNGGSNITLTWSDDDYTTWSSSKTFNLTRSRPGITNCGMFRRRAFQFNYTDNAPLRLKGMELTYNMGYN